MTTHSVHIASLGCARNDVDSEELAARLEHGGFTLVDDPEAAETVVVNTCGFVAQAKKDSIDTLLAAADLKDGGTVKSVVAVGCMAERYGVELAAELPEADAVLGFDAYADIAERLRGILDGEQAISHVPRDRRRLLPLTPSARPAAAPEVAVPGHVWLPGARRRLMGGPSASLKIASGCDRRCAFCAIPAFRGSYLSRPIDELEAEARWLVQEGAKELFLVSENTSSYGKDMSADVRLEQLLDRLSQLDGLDWIRVSYLQPAEIRPGFVESMLSIDKVVPYFDLSFQHASRTVLRRMRRFGDPDSFLDLIGRIRAIAPEAGIRSNVIAGFPGETDEDVQTLRDFIIAAQLDVLGVFGYSDEEGTEGVSLPDHLPDDVIEERRAMLADLAVDVAEARAADRIGDTVVVLVESNEDGDTTGRAEHQAPETDGAVTLDREAPVGSLVTARVVDSEGIDLIAEAL
ncbi:30S ribosomal protein S12 methylthiotransferase RimO [Tessaracoccus sp. MC1865]|uniref:30S ribosomal protein S12 methylthiotransferase RimO n=1 Tax=Tessaracoccus sp. MC1865 TaxID=2760310 RepID=UPI00160287A2|nr:30S ribosomal protein S12 methylthiotransferase RimO [Tessaracoccus sp. MC1865]MBB1483532.1 30S ribosomal protein S12 methylthiotransferase RimO [Tessaracoccus sp. MC1865]QTO36623.1 30S ribosomal protein S12 methylthiotransferase RimO [Tessaracoccus sp. MC1865]